jgi:hypothetical protein
VTAVKEERSTGTAKRNDRRQGTPRKAQQEPRLRIGHGELLRAIEKNTKSVDLPVVGRVHLPTSPDSLAWFGGLVALSALGIMEWPVAVAIGLGHVLAQNHHIRALEDFGEALEEA